MVKNMGEPYKTWMNERMGVDLLPRRRRPKKFNNIELTSMYKKKKRKKRSNTTIYHLHAAIILNSPPLYINWRGMNYKWENIFH